MPPPVNRNPIARMKNRILTNKVEREHLSGDIEALEQERQGIIGIMGVMVEKLNSTDDVIGELANDLATYEAAIAEIQQTYGNIVKTDESRK